MSVAWLCHDRKLPPLRQCPVTQGGYPKSVLLWLAGDSWAFQRRVLRRKEMFGFAFGKEGRVAGGRFSRNRGRVRQMRCDPAEKPLAITSLKIWRSLERNHGIETGFRRTGIGNPCRTAGDKVKVEKWAVIGDALGLIIPSDGRTEPSLAVPALVGEVRGPGAVLPEVCTVRGFETSGGMESDAVTGYGNIGAMPSWLRVVPGRARFWGMSVHGFLSCGYLQRRRERTGWKTYRKCPSAVVTSRCSEALTADTLFPTETPTSHLSCRTA